MVGDGGAMKHTHTVVVMASVVQKTGPGYSLCLFVCLSVPLSCLYCLRHITLSLPHTHTHTRRLGPDNAGGTRVAAGYSVHFGGTSKDNLAFLTVKGMLRKDSSKQKSDPRSLSMGLAKVFVFAFIWLLSVFSSSTCPCPYPRRGARSAHLQARCRLRHVQEFPERHSAVTSHQEHARKAGICLAVVVHDADVTCQLN